MGLFGKGKKEETAPTAAPTAAPEAAPAPAAAEQEEIRKFEASNLMNRSFECPVCGEKFTAKAAKSTIRRLGSDDDLRPKHEQLDTMKYGVAYCPKCGYASMERYFKDITDTDKEAIRQMQNPEYQEPDGPYTYDQALLRYQQAIKCIEARKNALVSEKAFTYLRTGWLMRGKMECVSPAIEGYDAKMTKLKKIENASLLKAYEGFYEAKQKENYPIAGMDEMTLDFMIAVLAARFEKYDVASKLISNIITDRDVNPRLKDKARELKDVIIAKTKKEEE